MKTFIICLLMESIVYLSLRKQMKSYVSTLILTGVETFWSTMSVCAIYLAAYIVYGKEYTNFLDSVILYVGIQTVRLVDLIRATVRHESAYKKAEENLPNAIRKNRKE